MWSTTLQRVCRLVGVSSSRLSSKEAYSVVSSVWISHRRSCSMAEGEETEKPTEAPEGFVEITEGRAKILFPSSNEVFYNPVQEFNRDLSTLVIKHYIRKLWEPNRKKRKKVWREAQDTDEEGKKRMKEDGGEGVGKGESGGDGEGEVGRGSGELGREETLIEMADVEGVQSAEEGKSPNKVAMDTDEVVGGADGDGAGEVGETMDRGRVVQSEELRILEALAASGLRSIRYALEVPQVARVVANDYSTEAYQNMCRNIKYNAVEGRVEPSCREATMLMYEHRDPLKQFTVIDLDPYGSPTIFLDSAVQAVSDGGLLCVTCTDASVLCGNHPETCYSKYGSVSLKLKCCHEMGVRIILSSLESHANRYRRYIVPLLSCSVDFYMRVFVQVFTSPAQVKKSLSKKAMVYACSGCESYHLQPMGRRLEEGASKKYPAAHGPPVNKRCDQCGSSFKLGGPIWAAPMHDAEFVGGLLEEVGGSEQDYHMAGRIKGLLTVISEELHDVPLHYVLDQLCNTLHCNTPKMLAFRSAILERGYRVSISHTSANAIKTDAPNSVLWDIMRCWVKENPVKLKPDTPAAAILSREPQFEACFTVRKDANPPSRLLKLARFPENPEANWGPKARAKRKVVEKDDVSSSTKRRKLQKETAD